MLNVSERNVRAIILFLWKQRNRKASKVMVYPRAVCPDPSIKSLGTRPRNKIDYLLGGASLSSIV